MRQPAVFLDRDGTVIELVHHLTDPEDVVLIDRAAEAVAALRLAGYRIVIVTNQSVIGRGKLTEAGLAEIHEVMQMRLTAADPAAIVDAIYFCPVEPTLKNPLVIEHPMRKPGPGMLLQAAREHAIDLSSSWMIGDTVSDMLSGRHAGCRTTLVQTGYGAEYCHDANFIDYTARNLADAANLILRERSHGTV